MASIQERLQLKRVSLDEWSLKEQLCLASAVKCSGDQNWMSVSRSLKSILGNSNRPKGNYSIDLSVSFPFQSLEYQVTNNSNVFHRLVSL